MASNRAQFHRLKLYCSKFNCLKFCRFKFYRSQHTPYAVTRTTDWTDGLHGTSSAIIILNKIIIVQYLDEGRCRARSHKMSWVEGWTEGNLALTDSTSLELNTTALVVIRAASFVPCNFPRDVTMTSQYLLVQTRLSSLQQISPALQLYFGDATPLTDHWWAIT
jgi:hypothetical protein